MPTPPYSNWHDVPSKFDMSVQLFRVCVLQQARKKKKIQICKHQTRKKNIQIRNPITFNTK